MTIDHVYSIWGYYDGILCGVAEFHGSPHYFEKDWSEEQQDYLPTFTMIPITKIELVEVVRGERIFREWEAKFHRGEVEEGTHPGEAGGLSNYSELQSSIKARSASPSYLSRRSIPEFSAVPGQLSRARGVMAQLQVVWRDAA